MVHLLLEQTPQPPFRFEAIFVALIAAMIVMTVVSNRSQKKERDRHRKWVDNLGKNEKVITKGGIHGSVWSVKDNVVVIKIDEDKGARMTVSKEAIIGSPKDKKDK